MRIPTAPLLTVALVAACRPIDVAPVTAVLDASVALGLAGSITMTAIAGEGPDCVTSTPECTAAPCAARLEVEVGGTCPLALGDGAGSTIILDGEWTDATHGTFVPDLTSMVDVEDGKVGLTLGAVVVSRDGDDVTVVFGEQEVDAGADGEADAAVDQQGWVVTVHLGGTPADPTDDVLDITGGGQTAGAEGDDGAVQQLALTLTVTEPSCRSNPVEGNVTVNDVGSDDGAGLSLLFHSECDGKADVLASSADPTKIGSGISLGYGGD